MKCPFLEEVIVRYCKAYPVRKMIPSSGEDSICLGEEHCACGTYREVARVDVQSEEDVIAEAPTRKAPKSSEYPAETPPVKGSADFFPAYWAKFCKVVNCPVCPYRFMCLGAERRWMREPVLIHGFEIIRDMYYSTWHTWLQIRKDKTVRIGLDDFSQNLLGNITGIELPEIGTILKEKESAWKVIVNGWEIDLLSPINGEIIDVNRKIADDLTIINRDPHKTGWILELKPVELDEKIELMLHDEKAISWLDSELDKLHSRVEDGIGVTIADGGELIDAISEKIDKSEWQKLIGQFLMTEPHKI